MSELKRCSCGGEPEVIEPTGFESNPTYSIFCSVCGKATRPFPTLKAAEKSWNTSTRRPSRRKYRRGPKIASLNELMEQDFVYWGNKIAPKGWFQNWPLHLAELSVRRGFLRQAIKIESEEPENGK